METMQGKPVFTVPAKTVINFDSGFATKLLCDGPTFSAGSACVYSCTWCYVNSLMARSPHKKGITQPHHEIVIRRANAAEIVRSQLVDAKGRPKFAGPDQEKRVIYSSPLVDVAANMELVRETISICQRILELTSWDIRLLSKSNLLPHIAKHFGTWRDAHKRIIYGVSTGTMDDLIARIHEVGTPLVSKRIESLRWLQDNGYRTYGMVCPSFPLFSQNYERFAEECREKLRYHRLEHVWAEVINLRGKSFTRTIEALERAGQIGAVTALEAVSESAEAWEQYARQTFEAHYSQVPKGKLRFMQYPKKGFEGYWYDNARLTSSIVVL